MSSREKILQAVREGKPDLVPLPSVIGFQTIFPDLAEQFGKVLHSIGGNLVTAGSLAEVEVYLKQAYDLSQPVVSTVAEIKGNVSPLAADAPHQFENLYLVLLKADLGVAESATVWVDEKDLILRALPFITLNLAIVVQERDLVANMHDAYEQLASRLSFQSGYGVFIAGPSKTADIEQSLVIGAHGPKSMTVFLIRNSSTNT